MFSFILDNDYSTPAARNYELDRTQITLNEIIGVGQFGDVHIGICGINKSQKPITTSDESSQGDIDAATNGEDKNIIHVAVKTCKADADLVTSEKFLEEACEWLKKMANATPDQKFISHYNVF